MPSPQTAKKAGIRRCLPDFDCPTVQDLFGQRAMRGDHVSGHRVELFKGGRHQTSAAPPNENNDRKNELAATAIDRPNTIWISIGAHIDQLETRKGNA